jgi:hypothetical protein
MVHILVPLVLLLLMGLRFLPDTIRIWRAASDMSTFIEGGGSGRRPG